MIKIINIQTSTVCNASCKSCNHKRLYGDKPKQVMSNDVWNKIVHDFKELQESKVSINGKEEGVNIIAHFGQLDEPLLDPYIYNRVSDLQNLGIKTGINTNCSKFTLDKVIQLYSLGVRNFSMSLISPYKQEFEEFTGLDFNQVLLNIYRALAFLNGKDVVLSISAARDDIEDVTEYKKLLGDFYKHLFIFKRDNREQTYRTEQIKFTDSCYRMLLGKQDYEKGCDVGFYRLYIAYDGTVYFCNMDSNLQSPIGNVMNESLTTITQKQINMILDMKNNPPKCCQDCYK